MEIEKAREKLRAFGQEHVLEFLPMLEEDGRENLLTEIESLDLQLVHSLSSRLIQQEKNDRHKSPIEPLHAQDMFSFSASEKASILRTGHAALSQGKTAILLVAGGQGTRLDHDHPKGLLDIGLPSGKTLFELQAQRLKKNAIKAGRDIPWYIMTSPINHVQTQDFFAGKRYFQLPAESVSFFQQGMLPAVDEHGKIILNDPSHLALSPNGNGGCFHALHESGAIQDMEERGVEYVFVYSVDNALIKMADPFFIGYTIESGQPISSKVVAKHSPDEKVGLLVLQNGKPVIIEYSEMPGELLNQRNGEGTLAYNNGNIAIHMFTLDFLKEQGTGAMPYHKAHKRIKTIRSDGSSLTPEHPNGYKFELFMFDLFPKADGMAALRVNRNEEFAPIKNKSGKDSPDSARALLMDLYNTTGWDCLI